MNQISNTPGWSGRSFLSNREDIENEIERLISLLDATDGDCDLEDGGDDEPSLGSTPIRCEYDLELDLIDDEDGEHGWSNPLGLRVDVPEELRELRKEGLCQ